VGKGYLSLPNIGGNQKKKSKKKNKKKNFFYKTGVKKEILKIKLIVRF